MIPQGCGVRLVVVGLSPEVIKETLSGELASMKARHERAQQISKFMSATAPSMGWNDSKPIKEDHELDSPNAHREKREITMSLTNAFFPV